MSFQEYLYTYLVEQDYIPEDEDPSVITADYIYGETDMEEEDLRDVWNSYVESVKSNGEEPDNDVEGWEP